MNFGKTIFNNDLDASHYQYNNIKRVSIKRRLSSTSRKERKGFQKNAKEYDAHEEYIRLVTM